MLQLLENIVKAPGTRTVLPKLGSRPTTTLTPLGSAKESGFAGPRATQQAGFSEAATVEAGPGPESQKGGQHLASLASVCKTFPPGIQKIRTFTLGTHCTGAGNAVTDWQAPPMIKKAVSNSAELPASCSGSPRDAASVELSSAGAGFSLMPLPLSHPPLIL